MALLQRLVTLAAALFSNAVVEIAGLQTGSRQRPQQQVLIEKDRVVGTSSMEESVRARRDDFKQAVRKLVDDPTLANNSQEDGLALEESDFLPERIKGLMAPATAKREVFHMLYGFRATKEYMHLPIIHTLSEAFRSTAGINVNVVWAHDDTCELERKLEASAGKGPMPVVIVNHWFFELSPAASCVPATYGDLLHKLSGLAYLIFYNDEPTERTGQDGIFLARTAVKYRVNEVWSYSNYMLSLTKSSLDAAKIISRYIPAGCAKAMDFGVENFIGATPRNYSQLGFLGKWEDRPAPVTRLLANGFGDRIKSEHNATMTATLKSYLSRCPLVQINPHSFRNPTGEALESFRIALLIMNGACVLSEPVHPLDQELFQDVVHFQPIERFHEVWEGLKDNEAAVTKCNQQARQSFCTDFAPSTLLLKSGFVALMSQMP